ncbi:hypothetical protein K0U91_03455 [Chryseobacterium chendengshani]|uniref:hypothetical protein n=1 Tax=Chryseobacterium sp. LJ668 TaxID=2864040 RepID=UPI001C68EE58|nr:hypothetical protein [Chryseobacterium sp. LJ668]MBW8524272.1 hypothetical protein [Chryseobacterium sp. LJ668]QYK17200.1 hypothetical protein K0U91_03455 [Chryseobacterium sp. LJ668]
MKRNRIIYHVKLHEPIEGKADFFFSSITAIYNTFTAEQIGVARQTLYQQSLQPGDEYRTKFCVVKKEEVLNNK